ncbi:hypothetical protein D3C76_1441560 [compost metagenome]
MDGERLGLARWEEMNARAPDRWTLAVETDSLSSVPEDVLSAADSKCSGVSCSAGP